MSNAVDKALKQAERDGLIADKPSGLLDDDKNMRIKISMWIDANLLDIIKQRARDEGGKNAKYTSHIHKILEDHFIKHANKPNEDILSIVKRLRRLEHKVGIKTRSSLPKTKSK